MKIEFLQVTQDVSGIGAEDVEDIEYLFLDKRREESHWFWCSEREDDIYIPCYITRTFLGEGCIFPTDLEGVSTFSFEGERYKTGDNRGEVKSSKLRFLPKKDPRVRSVPTGKARKNVRRRG